MRRVLPSPCGCAVVFLLVTVVTVGFGLHPKGYRFRNEVERSDDRPGLRFGRFGRAQTRPFLDAATATALSRGGFTLELALDPAAAPSGAGVLAMVHAGDDATPLVVWQWRQSLIVMNGDDFDYRRRLPRLTVDLAGVPPGPILLAVTSGTNGSVIYLNGRREVADPRVHLSLPAGSEPARIVLGNSVHANRAWQGGVSGFALYAHEADAGEIQAQAERWKVTAAFAALDQGRPLVRYRFEAGQGRSVVDHGTSGVPLEIPERLVALGRRALLVDGGSGTHRGSLLFDVVLNLVGFVPFGAALAACLARRPRLPSRGILLLATAAGFALSLGIELGQAWIPSRDSSLRDLLLNTVGAGMGGGWLAWWVGLDREGPATVVRGEEEPIGPRAGAGSGVRK